MNAWDIHSADLGWGLHPVVIVSHPVRAAHKDFVEILDCSSQRAARPALTHEVLLDQEDGLSWETLFKCDCIFAVERSEIKAKCGTVTSERRLQIVRTIISAHGWNTV